MLKQPASVLRLAAFLLLALIGRSIAEGGGAQATDAWLGKWRLNVAKSKYNPGTAPTSGTSRLEMVTGGSVKVTSDGIDGGGHSTHTEVVTMFDGQPSELKGTNPPVTLAFSRIDSHHYELVTRVGGKIAATSRVSVSADGKTRTLVTTSTGADGKSTVSTVVYDRR